MKKTLAILSTVISLTLALTACGGNETTSDKTGTASAAASQKLEKIKIGVSSTPHAVIIEKLQPEFKAAGLDVESVIFEDFVQPNIALNDGSLDANYFQHKPYFDAFTKEQKLDLEVLGYVHIEPMGLYSTKYKSVDEIKDGDEILLPNDVTNGARALLLLEKAGLLKLKSDALDVTPLDVKENPKNLKLTQLNAPTIPSAYKDAAAGVINSNFLISAGIDPSTALIREDGKNNPYANLVAVRKGDAAKEKFQKLIKVLTSEKAKEIIKTEFKGEIQPA